MAGLGLGQRPDETRSRCRGHLFQTLSIRCLGELKKNQRRSNSKGRFESYGTDTIKNPEVIVFLLYTRVMTLEWTLSFLRKIKFINFYLLE